MNLTAAIPWYVRWLALAALCAAFGSWCYVRGMAHTQAKWDADKLKQTQDALAKDAEYRAKERAWSKKMEDARNDATKREIKLRADLTAARDESDGLRNDLAEYRRRLPSLTESAVRRYADAASFILDDCQRKYQNMADTADRIDSDRQTLMDAWPK